MFEEEGRKKVLRENVLTTRAGRVKNKAVSQVFKKFFSNLFLRLKILVFYVCIVKSHLPVNLT